MSYLKLIGFVISALLAGVVGILFAARNGAAAAAIGEGAELRVITAVIVVGDSLSVGKGTIFGSFLGVLFISLINSILIVIQVPTFWYSFIISFILLIAVVVDVLLSRKRV